MTGFNNTPLALYQKAIYLQPDLALKGGEKTAYELLKACNSPLSASIVALNLKLSRSHASQVLNRLVEKRVVTKSKFEKGYRYMAVTPKISDF